MSQNYVSKLQLPDDVQEILNANNIIIPETRQQLLELTFQGRSDALEITYDVPGRGKVLEATVTRCKNGASVNYAEAYMRRRDPDAMVIADDKPTDKMRFSERFGKEFDSTRRDTMDLAEEPWRAHCVTLQQRQFRGQLSFSAYCPLPIRGFFVMGLADFTGFYSCLPDS